jgi:hypothetical protein
LGDFGEAMIELKRHSAAVLELRIPYTNTATPFDFFLASDIHLDNPKCNRKLLAKHLDEAAAKNAPALFFGDVMCLMQSRSDKRGSKSSIRPEHIGDNYFDLVFNETANWFSNWKDTIVMMSDGNHETSILNHNEIDPLENVTRLMREQGSKCQHMGYQGFIWFTFYQRNPDGSTGKTRRATLAFHHGAWSGASKSTGQKYFNIFPQAQIVLNGHNHERSIISHPAYNISANGTQTISHRLALQSGTYKEEFKGGSGFAVEKIVMPKSLGGLFLRLRPRDSTGVEITCELAT